MKALIAKYHRPLVRKAAWIGSFAVMAAVIVLIAPTPAPPKPRVAAAVIPHCATVLAEQMSSPGVVVPGSYACLSASEQARAAGGGIASDQDMAAVAAQSPQYTSYRYVGHTTNGYYFQMSPGPGCYRFHVDAQGEVDAVAYGAVACPSPLP